MKTCSSCGEAKPVDAFSRRRASKDGRGSRCKSCEAAWRAANRERMAATNAAWYAANRDRKAATNAAWRAANRERMAATNAAYWAEHREDYRINNRNYYYSTKGQLAAIRSNAGRRQRNADAR